MMKRNNGEGSCQPEHPEGRTLCGQVAEPATLRNVASRHVYP